MNSKKDGFHWVMWQGVGAFSWFMWIASSFLSYWGFTHLGNVVWWIKILAGGFAIGINFVEFMLNNLSMDEVLSIKSFGDLVLRLFGIVCYAYDVWTNILGFGLVVIGATELATGDFNLMTAWQINPTMVIFAILFGIGFAIGPEPLYVMFLREKFPYPVRQVSTKNQSSTQYNVPKSVTNLSDDFKRKYSSETYRPVKH